MFNFFRKKKDEGGKGKHRKEPERPPRKTELKNTKMGNNYSKLEEEETKTLEENKQETNSQCNGVLNQEVEETKELINKEENLNMEESSDVHVKPLTFNEDIIDADEEAENTEITIKTENIISESPEIYRKNNITDSRAKFFDELLGGERNDDAFAKSEPVEIESPSDEEMISLRSIGLIESFPSIKEEDEDETKLEKKKKHVHWADSHEGRCLETFEEFTTPSSSSEDEEDDEGEELNVDEGEEVDDDSLEDEEEEDEEDDDKTEDNIPDDWRQDDNKITNINESESEEESEEDEESEEEEEIVQKECVAQINTENNALDNHTKTDNNQVKNDTDGLEMRILYSKLTEVQKDLLEKASKLEKAQSDLEEAYNQAEYAKRKVDQLETDLDEHKRRNTELARRLSEEYVSVEDRKKLKDADIKVAELEYKLREIRGEKEKLEASFSVLRMERDNEIQRVKNALNAALAEKKEQEAKYQKEFESLRTLNSGREIQMLDDFEWKLREVEKMGKKKISDAVEERDKKITELTSKLERAEADLEQLVELKACEIELKQLKITSAEQRKNLRLIQRKLEDIQVNEMILQEEVNRLRIALDKEKTAMSSLQTIHREEIAEKDRKLTFKLEYQKNQLNAECEDKIKRDCAKLKSDLERTFREERMSAVDTAKRLKDQELANQRHNYEKKIQDLKNEVEGFKERLKVKEGKHQMDLQKAQTNTDREILDMRRQLDKLDMSYQEKIEKIQENHEKEINTLKSECDKKITQYETTLQQQMGTTRTTLELVKQSMHDEHQIKMDKLIRKHERDMSEQWDKWQSSKEREIQEMQSSHRKTVELLQLQLDVLRKSKGSRIETKVPEQTNHTTDLVLVGDHTTKITQSPFSSRLEPEGGPNDDVFEECAGENFETDGHEIPIETRHVEGNEKVENQESPSHTDKPHHQRHRRRNRKGKRN